MRRRLCFGTRLTTPWVSPVFNLPEDKALSGEGWTGLTKPALSISAL